MAELATFVAIGNIVANTTPACTTHNMHALTIEIETLYLFCCPRVFLMRLKSLRVVTVASFLKRFHNMRLSTKTISVLNFPFEKINKNINFYGSAQKTPEKNITHADRGVLAMSTSVPILRPPQKLKCPKTPENQNSRKCTR